MAWCGDFKKRYGGRGQCGLGCADGASLRQGLSGGGDFKGAVVAGGSDEKAFEVYLGGVVAALGCAFCGEKKPAKLIEKLSFGAYAKKFADGECRVIPLVITYRSNSDIVDFYNEWMATTDGAKFKSRWDNFRYAKRIEPHEQTTLHSPAAVTPPAVHHPHEWHEPHHQHSTT